MLNASLLKLTVGTAEVISSKAIVTNGQQDLTQKG